jgi:WS/DGAT/MGAT family acyltransferase
VLKVVQTPRVPFATVPPTGDNRGAVPRPDRLSALDASFLALEKDGAHMHVGSVLVFDGPAPTYDALVEHIERRLHLVPRYRRKLAHPPLGQGRPVWVDDPRFNAGYHVRHTALPGPAGEAELRALAGRVFSQELDRTKPLWEIWLVERVGDDAFALVCKTHHALVDGISGVDIMTVLFDLEPGPPPPPASALVTASLAGPARGRTARS